MTVQHTTSFIFTNVKLCAPTQHKVLRFFPLLQLNKVGGQHGGAGEDGQDSPSVSPVHHLRKGGTHAWCKPAGAQPPLLGMYVLHSRWLPAGPTWIGRFGRSSPVLTGDGAFSANKMIIGIVGQTRPVRVPRVPVVEAVDSDRVGEGDEGKLPVAKGGHCPGWRQRWRGQHPHGVFWGRDSICESDKEREND